jgi:hypothetical protein
MNEPVEAIKKLISECSKEEQRALKQYLGRLLPHPLESEWAIDGDAILSAIRRSSDLTKRGVRGIIAEAVFESAVIPSIVSAGWESVFIVGNLPYDVQLRKGDTSARIQIKLQRLEKGIPKRYHPRHYEEGLFVVEVQKTRSGEKKKKQALPGTETTLEVTENITEKTRPYRFGDFDILAVNMQPSSSDWKNFRYTVASWLLPRQSDKSLIEIFQPVAPIPNDVWTSDLPTCLEWLVTGEKRTVLTNILHLPKPKSTVD